MLKVREGVGNIPTFISWFRYHLVDIKNAHVSLSHNWFCRRHCCRCRCCCPGAPVAVQGPLAPLSAAIHSAVVQAGQALEVVGAKSLGAFVMEHLDSLKQAGWVVYPRLAVTNVVHVFSKWITSLKLSLSLGMV